MRTIRIASLACLLAGLSVVQGALADVYAGRGGGTFDDANVISRFGDQQSGNVAPISLLGGIATGFTGSTDIFFDAQDRVFYVSEHYGDTVRVFSEFASGNEAPLRVISTQGGLQPTGVQVIAQHNELIISGSTGIKTVPRNANGEVAATRHLLSGFQSTKLDYPTAMVYSASTDELFVADYEIPTPGTYVGEVLVFPRTANYLDAPSRTISGNLTGLGLGTLDLAINPVAGELYVLSYEQLPDESYQWLVQTFLLNAGGNVAPIRSIRGANTQLEWAASLAYDSSNAQLVVANNAGTATPASLLFFPRTANGNVAPAKVISGSNTGVSNVGDGWWSVTTVDHTLVFKDGFE